EGDASTAPTSPVIDRSTWRYYGEIYQVPSVKDPNHFSLLDHLRHLLVQAPELKALGLPGGLSIWLVRNVEEIAKWALSAKERWEIKDIPFMRQQLVNILYYLMENVRSRICKDCRPVRLRRPKMGRLPASPTLPC